MVIFEGLVGLTTTGLISISVAYYLAKKLLDHRLTKDLKNFNSSLDEIMATHKAGLDQAVNAAKAEVEVRLKRELEEYLGDISVERTYRADARKRLYLAVGPLRFQLIVAAGEWANRVVRFGEGAGDYRMSIGGHFLRSTAYRLLRVLAISELIERQIAIADFAVDPEMRALLKFKRLAFQCLSGDEVSLKHPGEVWRSQKQHIFYDNLSKMASALIVQCTETKNSRILRFDEFVGVLPDESFVLKIDPMHNLMLGFKPSSKPILWLRLLALAQLCVGLVKAQGNELGIDLKTFDLDLMLNKCNDQHILSNKDQYSAMLQRFEAETAK